MGIGPMRVDGWLSVSRGFGDFQFKDESLPPADCKVTAVPEVQTVRCGWGDWLLIACDGVFDVMASAEVSAFIHERLNPAEQQDCGAIVAELVRHCLQLGSRDNCT